MSIAMICPSFKGAGYLTVHPQATQTQFECSVNVTVCRVYMLNEMTVYSKILRKSEKEIKEVIPI